MPPDLSLLEKQLGYRFRDREILVQALRHSSYVNEIPDKTVRDNELLEFLGDAVLSLTISHLLWARFPDRKEGDLSKIRAGLVNESQLSGIARTLHLGDFLQMGRGELQSGGREKNSILADALEALLAAVYLDGGFDAAFAAVNRHFSDPIENVALFEETQDYKSRIQERVQASGKPAPVYRIVQESGPDHDKTFEAELTIGEISARGMGKSKKTAEQAAAQKAIALLESMETPESAG